MSNHTIFLDDRIYGYLLEVSLDEPGLLRRLRDETAELPLHNMQIGPEQGQFMALLVRLIGAEEALEIGTFTGYSSLCIARALGEGGRLVTCEVNAEWAGVAKAYWAEAGLEDRIELHLAPARDTLDALIAGGGAGTFDFAFIDADKAGYDAYFEKALTLVRPGGLICIDNVLWSGAVADPQINDQDTRALRALNRKLHRDRRVDISLVPIGDGLTLARKTGG